MARFVDHCDSINLLDGAARGRFYEFVVPTLVQLTVKLTIRRGS